MSSYTGGLAVLRGTDAEIVCQLSQMQQHDQKSGGFRVEIQGIEPFEIKFNNTYLHIHPKPSDLCARVCAWSMMHGAFKDLREIKISTFVAPYLERALESMMRLNPARTDPVYICFRVAACAGAESAAIVRCLHAISRAACVRPVHVAVVHYACVCPLSCGNVFHEFMPQMWAIATHEFFNACDTPESSIVHEFANSSTDELALVHECHRLLPKQNWCTIAPHRMTFPTGFASNALLKHTSRWSVQEWGVGRVLQVRQSSPTTTIPTFDSLVPICGAVSIDRFRDLGCLESALPVALSMLANREWAECVTLNVAEDTLKLQRALHSGSLVRVSKLRVDITKADPTNLQNTLQFMSASHGTMHTLELCLRDVRLTEQAIDGVLQMLQSVPNLRHLVISGAPQTANELLGRLFKTLKHATLRKLTIPVSDTTAKEMGVLMAREAADLPALNHVHLILDAKLGRARIENILIDYANHPNFKRLTGVSLTLTHPGQRAPAAVLLQRFLHNLTCVRCLKVRFNYKPTAAADAAEFLLADTILECARFLKNLECLVLDIPVPVRVINALLVPNYEAKRLSVIEELTPTTRLQTLHANVQQYTDGDKHNDAAIAFWPVLVTQATTLRDLRLNANFVDSFCHDTDLMLHALRQLRLDAADVQNSVYRDQFERAVATSGPANVSVRSLQCRPLRRSRRRSGGR
jgi:hypothetical protein